MPLTTDTPPADGPALSADEFANSRGYEAGPENQIEQWPSGGAHASGRHAVIDAESLVEEFTRTSKTSPLDPEIRTIARHQRRPVTTTACPVCDGDRAEPLYQVGGSEYRLAVCTGCGLGSLFPRPEAREIARFYPNAYYGTPDAKFQPFIERTVRKVTALRARMLLRGLPRGARVLDVGCGRGVLLTALSDLGCEAHGTEISSSVAAAADPRAEVRIAARLEDAEYPTGFFDAVVLWHVLEHLPEPRGTIEEIHRVLRPGGRLIVAVPNFSSLQAGWAGDAWFHLDLPRHLYHYPAKALQTLLERSGFECDAVRHLSLRQNPFGWVQSALNRCPGLPRNALYNLLHDGTPEAEPSRWTRRFLQLAWWLGMPLGLVLGLLETACRSGATVQITARRAERVCSRQADRLERAL